jgi:hypothetical protein
VFDLEPDVVKRGETKALDSLLRARFRAALPAPELSIDASDEPARALRWLGTLAP